MADQTLILSVDEEAKLLQPIDEYVGKIQEQIDALRVEGSDRVNSLKNKLQSQKRIRTYPKKSRQRLSKNARKSLRRPRMWKIQINRRFPS